MAAQNLDLTVMFHIPPGVAEILNKLREGKKLNTNDVATLYVNLFDAIRSDMAQMRAEIKNEIGGINKKMEDLSGEINKLAVTLARVEERSKRIDEMAQQINNMNNQIIEIYKFLAGARRS